MKCKRGITIAAMSIAISQQALAAGAMVLAHQYLRRSLLLRKKENSVRRMFLSP